MRDSQKQRCYNWQYKVAARYPELLNKRLTNEEAQALVEKICKAHGVNVPVVEETWGAKRSYYQKAHRKWTARKGIVQVPERIKLSTKDNRWGFKLLVVLHEACHALANKYVKDEADHGPTYMRLFYDLIVKFGKVDAAEIRQLARDMGVQIAPAIKYELNESIRGVIPVVPQRPIAHAPTTKEKPKTRTKRLQPAPVPKTPWLRPATPEEKVDEYWITCRQCKKVQRFTVRPVGFQWCDSCKKKGYGV